MLDKITISFNPLTSLEKPRSRLRTSAAIGFVPAQQHLVKLPSKQEGVQCWASFLRVTKQVPLSALSAFNLSVI